MPTPPEHELQAQLLRAAAALLAGLDGPQAGQTLTARVGNGRGVAYELTRLAPTAVSAPADTALAWLLETYLSEEETRIVLALAGGPRKALGVARALGLRRPNSRLRTLLANLVERGVLRLDAEGYAADGRGLAAARQRVDASQRNEG